MAARSVTVHVHNETGTHLYLVEGSAKTSAGKWGSRRPPDQIEPWTVATFNTTSKGPVDGTEARVTYEVLGNPNQTLYMHWNNPLVGTSSFHTNTSHSHHSFWLSRRGNDSHVHFYFRPAGTVATDFTVAHDGFKFPNKFADDWYRIPQFKDTILDKKWQTAKAGLCGGMVFAALDYFHAGWEIPQDTTAPRGDKHPLWLYLVARLIDSFDPGLIATMYGLMNPAFPDGDETVLTDLTLGASRGRAGVMAHDHWPLIRADIDAGRPSPVAVITVKSLNPGDLGLNHQVLAYKYEAHGHNIVLHLYDPNLPGKMPTMRFSVGETSRRIVVEHDLGVGGRPVYAFLRMNWTPRVPPVKTRPRLTLQERAGRRVVINEVARQVTSTAVQATGRAVVPVYPNCGNAEFDFTMYREAHRITLQAATPFFRSPTLEWSVGDAFVKPDSTATLELARNTGPGSLIKAESTTLKTGQLPPAPKPKVTVEVRAQGSQLILDTRPEDGNFTLVVKATCYDATDGRPDRKQSTIEVGVDGMREEIPGYANAVATCFRALLTDTHNQQADPAEAAAALLTWAQQRRPADPLWDPDPIARSVSEILVEHDPLLNEVLHDIETHVRPEIRLVEEIRFPDEPSPVQLGHVVDWSQRWTTQAVTDLFKPATELPTDLRNPIVPT